MNTPKKYIENFQLELLSNAQEEGKQQALLNRPTTLDEFSAGYFNLLEHTVQLEINKNNQMHKPLSGQAMANKTQQEKNEHIRKVQADKFDTERELKRLKLRKDSCGCSLIDIIKKNMIYIIIALLAITEGYFIYQALTYSSISTVMSFLIGFGIASGLFILTDIIASFILRVRLPWKVWARSILVLTLVFTVFYLFGLLRLSGMAQESFLEASLGGSTSDAGSMSALTLAGLSTFIFGIGLLITMKYKPSQSDRENMKEYRRIYFRIRNCKRKLKKLHNEINTARDQANSVSMIAMNNFEDAVHTEKSLVSMAHQALHEYIQTNIKYRGGHVPNFFAHPPKFHFQSFMNTASSSHNQNEIL